MKPIMKDHCAQLHPGERVIHSAGIKPGRYLFRPEPTRRFWHLWLPSAALLAAFLSVVAIAAYWVYRAGAEPAGVQTPARGWTHMAATRQAVADARVEGFRAGYEEALLQQGGCRPLALSPPLEARP